MQSYNTHTKKGEYANKGEMAANQSKREYNSKETLRAIKFYGIKSIITPCMEIVNEK